MYYLNSRYYDPGVCRFLNADSYVSTGQGVLGHNMFAYCNNNPVTYADSEGTMLHIPMETKINDGVYLSHKSDTSSNEIYGTVSMGGIASVSIGPIVFAGQLSICSDLAGNSELQFTYANSFSTSTPSVSEMLENAGKASPPSVMLAANISVTNAPSVAKLHGMGYQIGGAIHGVALDYIILPDPSENTTYSGWGYSVGMITLDAHVTPSFTSPIIALKFNLFEYFDSLDEPGGIYG